MKRTMILAGAILLFATTATAAPFQWGGNGHWYDVVWVDAGLSWQDARDLADQRGGHLVSLTSGGENDFVWSLQHGNKGEGTQDRSSWPMGYQRGPNDERFGHWAWVRGEEWPYEPRNPNEPNNGMGGTQHSLHYWDTRSGEWDDMDNRRHRGGHAVEFGQFPDPSVASAIPTPEPATMLLLGVGLIGLAGFQRKILKK